MKTIRTKKWAVQGVLATVAALTLTTATRMVHADGTTSRTPASLGDAAPRAPWSFMMPTTSDDTQAHMLFIGGKTTCGLIYVGANSGGVFGIATNAAAGSLIAPALD